MKNIEELWETGEIDAAPVQPRGDIDFSKLPYIDLMRAEKENAEKGGDYGVGK